MFLIYHTYLNNIQYYLFNVQFRYGDCCCWCEIKRSILIQIFSFNRVIHELSTFHRNKVGFRLMISSIHYSLIETEQFVFHRWQWIMGFSECIRIKVGQNGGKMTQSDWSRNWLLSSSEDFIFFNSITKSKVCMIY